MSYRERTNDLTLNAVLRQVTAMGCSRYEIGIRDIRNGRMMNKEWSKHELLKRISWLKYMNACGNDIYIRPHKCEPHALVLVDDLSSDDIDRMNANGHEPSLVVETSPKNFQCWLRLSNQHVAFDERDAAAKGLARLYEADPASAEARHYGRLAGFTNQKDERTMSNGQQPWVLCRLSSRIVISSCPTDLIKRSPPVPSKNSVASGSLANERGKPADNRAAIRAFRSEMAGLIKRFGDDLSRCDFIATKKLASKGFSATEIAEAMRIASPNLSDRKIGHAADYIQRTVNKAMRLPDVKQARRNIEHKRSDRKRSGTQHKDDMQGVA